MKKILFSIFIFSLPLLARAQSAVPPTENPDRWTYAEIVGEKKFMSFGTKVNVSIDYGQRFSLVTDKRIRDNDGKVKDFNSMVDAMNYMASGGWEFCQAYAVGDGQNLVYHWLMRADKANMTFTPATK